MKNPADRRRKMTDQMNENEKYQLTNKSIIKRELFGMTVDIENVRPYSPCNRNFKNYEEGALSTQEEIPDRHF